MPPAITTRIRSDRRTRISARPTGDALARLQRALVLACALIATAAAAACSTLPKNDDRVASMAFGDTDDTTLGRIAGASLAAATGPAATGPTPTSPAVTGDDPPEVSAFQLVSAGDEAFSTLYALISRAERSLDLQYYIVADDPYSHTLLRAAREAAERGVRVRLLVDDFYTTGNDERIAWYAAHPNIQVRVFNPFAGGRSWLATRLLVSIADIDRINRRMHNKLFIADNALAVTGGRNMGAAYYQHSERTNFLDLDVLAAGPIVKDLSDTFDQYWNSAFAYPIERFTRPSDLPWNTVDKRALDDPNDPVIGATAEAKRLGEVVAKSLDSGRLAMTRAPTELVADHPTKIRGTRPRLGRHGLIGGSTIATDILSIIATAEDELIIISPYFVPGERGTEALHALRRRGVRVRVLTNSLAATDAAIVHIGYSRYRRTLIEDGVEILELRPEPGEEGTKLGAVGSSKASLHAKALIIDRKTLFIGSFNVDPRSSLENTEMGLEIDSEALCGQIVGILRDRGERSRYRVTIAADGTLQWTTATDGVEQVFHDEPGAGAWTKFALKLFAPFAPEQMM